MNYELLLGDCIEVMRTLPAASVQTCVTSPPYLGLRSYLADGHPDKALEIGTEQTPDAYVAKLVDVFREVRRVLRDDGTLWLNLGDSYANPGNNRTGEGEERNLSTAKFHGGSAHLQQRRTVIKTSNRYRLRADLSPTEVAYVLEELAKHSRIASATIVGDE